MKSLLHMVERLRLSGSGQGWFDQETAQALCDTGNARVLRREHGRVLLQDARMPLKKDETSKAPES